MNDFNFVSYFHSGSIGGENCKVYKLMREDIRIDTENALEENNI